jgi:hypothetical protein
MHPFLQRKERNDLKGSRDVIAQIEDMIAELGPAMIEPRAELARASATVAM